MKYLAFIIIIGCGLPTALRAAQVNIAEGGFSVESPENPKFISKAMAPNAPANSLFPRVYGKHFFLDSVSWGKLRHGDSLESLLKQRSEASQFSYDNAKPFTANSGLTGIRFILKPERPEDKIPLHRFIFQNSKGEVICVGCFGTPDNVESLLDSIALLN